MRIKIEVTAKDIKNGTCYDPDNCAIAHAINRYLKPSTIASVCYEKYGTINLRPSKVELPDMSLNSAKAARYARRFDVIKKDAKPFSFTINIRKGNAELYFKKAVVKSAKG